MLDIEAKTLSKITDVSELEKMYRLGLRPELFFNSLNRAVVEFTIGYWRDSGFKLAPTTDVLRREFKAFSPMSPVEESTEWLTKSLRERTISADLKNAFMTYSGNVHDDPEGVLANMLEALRFTKMKTRVRTGRLDLAVEGSERINRYLDRVANMDRLGAPLGLDMIDEYMGGTLKGQFAILAGFTNTGKSFYGVKSAVEAFVQGWSPILFTLEQSEEEMLIRAVSIITGIENRRIVRGEILPNERSLITDTLDALQGSLRIEMPPENARTPADLVARAREVGADYMIVDQLSFVRSSNTRLNSARDILIDVVRELKALISDVNASPIPCLALAQLNRESQKSKRPSLIHLAEASELERISDTIYIAWQTREMLRNNSQVLFLEKARNQEKKAWLIEWHLAKGKIGARDEYREFEDDE